MAEVTWTRQALEDLEAICLFIARDAPPAASVVADRAFESADLLAEHPRLGRVVPETKREDLREVFIWNYRLIYRFRDDRVQILTLHHGSRMLSSDRLEST